MTKNLGLPKFASLLVVCAHPDDESFGLGAVLHAFATGGSKLSVVCFTHGEASTLHGVDGDLNTIRAAELAAASEHLAVDPVELLDYPDGALAAQSRDELVDHILRTARDVDADGLLVFDEGGITGHPDHEAATDAALDAAGVLDLPVLAWAIPAHVAAALNDEFGTTFVGREKADCNIVLEVDRDAQLDAIDCHASQSRTNPVMRRRLGLQQQHEWLRVLRPGSAARAWFITASAPKPAGAAASAGQPRRESAPRTVKPPARSSAAPADGTAAGLLPSPRAHRSEDRSV